MPTTSKGRGSPWAGLGRSSVFTPLLPANGPVLKGLLLPDEYAITSVASIGRDAFFQALDRRLSTGLQLIQIREPGLERDELAALAEHEGERRKALG